MKFPLKKSGRKRQEAIREAIRSGVPLAGMLAAAAFTAGCGEKAGPVVIGAIAVSEAPQPSITEVRVLPGEVLAPEPPAER